MCNFRKEINCITIQYCLDIFLDNAGAAIYRDKSQMQDGFEAYRELCGNISAILKLSETFDEQQLLRRRWLS